MMVGNLARILYVDVILMSFFAMGHFERFTRESDNQNIIVFPQDFLFLNSNIS